MEFIQTRIGLSVLIIAFEGLNQVNALKCHFRDQMVSVVEAVQLTDEMNGPEPDKIHTRAQKKLKA